MTDERLITTYRYEKLRAVASGTIEAAAHTFLLLIAVRWFEAGSTAKSLVAAAGSFGLLVSPLVVTRVESSGWPVSRAASVILAIGALSFLAMHQFPTIEVYVPCCILAMACSTTSIPLMTQVYQENYPGRERGRRFARTVMIRIGAAAGCSYLAGRALDGHMENFRWLLLGFAGAFALSSFCVYRVPSRPLKASGGKHPLRALRYAKTDRLFRLTLIAWMFMGFGNLMMFPMRVEYLANPEYNLVLPEETIALIVGVYPNLARFLTSAIWGWLFDHVNFFALRAVLNLLFGLGICVFFASESLFWLIGAAVLFGIASGGGDVAWSLWVTKFAPPERVADYMSTHTFFTGVRGVAAPFAGYLLVRELGMKNLGFVSLGLIIISILLLAREIPWGRKARQADALVEEVSD
ncbi:MAG: hypothetical protein CMO80_21085 [Verrucomicrobiales bacterium]|nr:hypothetical protein [Verrucomicrobiales bacterium]|tara:strand:+ start:20013 stop:21239 length:1227 start_codon:yes stop_codon:yes gene_type:complete